jgi:hypothetical protein
MSHSFTPMCTGRNYQASFVVLTFRRASTLQLHLHVRLVRNRMLESEFGGRSMDVLVVIANSKK